MNKCNCYVEVEKLRYSPFYTQSYYKTVGICNGTKEREECSCGGNETKCDFYPAKRAAAQAKSERHCVHCGQALDWTGMELEDSR